MPKKPKPKPAEALTDGWPERLDAAVRKKFNVEVETSFDILEAAYRTTWDDSLDANSQLMIRVFVQGYMAAMEDAVDTLQAME